MRPSDPGSDDLLPREPRERPWVRITPFARIISLLFFGLFLYELVRDMEMPHLVDNAFMQIHAGGHALFRVFGLTAAVAGGTFLQLFVPFALGGRYESLIHDWNYLFTQLGVLSYDTVIAGIVRSIGCLGMIGLMFWFLWHAVIDIELDR